MFTYDLTDEEYALPYNAPGTSKSYFDLDDEFRDFVPKRRSDAIKLETILGNSGDMDIETVGGPTGFAGEGLDKGIRSYQRRNGLKVDGWVRPGGPTITKMKEQFGGLLGDYEAPSPRQSDTHHRMRDAGYPGFLKPKRQDLLLPPIPGLPKPNDNILGGNHSLVRTVRDKGMQNAAGYMAGQVRHLGQEGVVEARDFVDQLDKLMPGEGTKAIRGILQSLADIPGLQRAFFGGPVIETAPIGVFEHDGPQRFDEAIKTKPWEEAEQGRKIPGGDPGVRDMAWTPERDGGDRNELTRPHQQQTEEQQQQGMTPRSHAVGAGAFADAGTPHNPNDLLDPRNWPDAYRTQALASRDEALAAEATATDKEDQDAQAIQIAQAQPGRGGGSRSGNPSEYFDLMEEPVRRLAERLNTDPMFIHALFTHESGWMNENARARNNPSGSLLSNRDGTRTHDVKPDMDSALAAWEKRWGDRVRNAPSIQEFVEGLQQLRPGEPNPHRYNPDETRHNLKRPQTDSNGNRIPPYEDLVTGQIYSVIRHHNAWQSRRGKAQ